MKINILAPRDLEYEGNNSFTLRHYKIVSFWLVSWLGLKASTTRVQYREQGKVEDQKVATIAIFVHEIMEAEMASFRRENLMHQVYGVKNWIADCLAYLQNFLQKGLKSSALPLTKSYRSNAFLATISFQNYLALFEHLSILYHIGRSRTHHLGINLPSTIVPT